MKRTEPEIQDCQKRRSGRRIANEKNKIHEPIVIQKYGSPDLKGL